MINLNQNLTLIRLFYFCNSFLYSYDQTKFDNLIFMESTNEKNSTRQIFAKRVTRHYILFFVLMAVTVGIALTFFALNIYSNENWINAWIPVYILIAGGIPTIYHLVKALKYKKQMSNA